MEASTSVVAAINDFLYTWQFVVGFFAGGATVVTILKFTEGRPIFGRKPEVTS